MEQYIYLIACTETKRIYVGRSERSFRMRHHLSQLRSNKHHIKLMQSDFNQYGEDSFSFTIIQSATLEVKADHGYECQNEILKCGEPNRTKSEMKKSEKEWMIRLKTYNPHYGYNYLDPYFINGLKNNKIKRRIVSEKYDFQESLL